MPNQTPPADSDVVNLLSQLVAIDSRNPLLVPGGPGESEIATVVAELLQENRLEVQVIESTAGRPSVIGILKGSGGGRSLLLNAHMDTVGFGSVEDMLTPRIEGDRLYGRGAYDMKGGLTAILLAAARLAQEEPLRGDLIITAVSDEEHSSIGTQEVVEYLQAAGIRPDGAIVTEPTELQLTVAHKGFAWVTITTTGRAAHGSRRAEGIDAIGHMGRVLVAVEALDSYFQTRNAHPLLGHASLHASLIEGGTGLSTYPPHCTLQIERRALPDETQAAIRDEIAAILDDLRAEDPQFQADFEITLFQPGLETSLTDPVVQTVSEAMQLRLSNSNEAPTPMGVSFWMDSALLAQAGIPTVIFGPAGTGAHADVEWVELSSISACIDVLMATARAFCG